MSGYIDFHCDFGFGRFEKMVFDGIEDRIRFYNDGRVDVFAGYLSHGKTVFCKRPAKSFDLSDSNKNFMADSRNFYSRLDVDRILDDGDKKRRPDKVEIIACPHKNHGAEKALMFEVPDWFALKLLGTQNIVKNDAGFIDVNGDNQRDIVGVGRDMAGARHGFVILHTSTPQKETGVLEKLYNQTINTTNTSNTYF